MIVERPRDHGLKFKPFDLGVSARWLQQQRRKSLARIGKSPREAALIERIKRLKKEAGTHSPSAWTLAQRIPELRLKVDACFLSNPYATKLFMMHFHREVIRPRKLRALLELYPSQNRVIAAKLGRVLELDPESIFVGNGAVEIIQAILAPVHAGENPGQPADIFSLLRVQPARDPGHLQRLAQGRRLPIQSGCLPRPGSPRTTRHGRVD